MMKHKHYQMQKHMLITHRLDEALSGKNFRKKYLSFEIRHNIHVLCDYGVLSPRSKINRSYIKKKKMLMSKRKCAICRFLLICLIT